MKKSISRLLICLLAAAAMPLAAVHIGFAMPSGARRGTEVEVTFGGQKFGGVDGCYVSGEGVTVTSVESVRNVPHPDGRQRRYLYKVLRNLHRGDPRKIPLPENTEGWRWHPFYDRLANLSDGEREILYRFLFIRKNSLQDSPAIRGRVLVRLSIAPDAKPGEREIRLVAGGRVSNPLKFFISTAPEYRDPYFVIPPGKPHVPQVEIPAVLNGQIYPGETDSFTFEAEKNQTYTFSAKARYLMPFIGDGVPGHFQMVMEVLDPDGKKVAFADDNYFDPDPVLTFTAPASGRYTLRLRDALYRGREDFVYRVEAYKGKMRKPEFPAPPVRGLPVVQNAAGKSVFFPVLLRDTLRTAAGNSYKFQAEPGEVVMLEVFARRLGLPPDAVLQVFDRYGKVLAANDDVPRLKAGIILHGAADPVVRFTAPEAGTYTVNVRDVAGEAGEDHGYYLRIDRVRPRFAVYCVPSAVIVSSDGVGTATMVVERYDGFNGEIKLHLRHEDFKIIGTDSIPAGCDRAKVTFYTSGRRMFLPPQEVDILASGGGYSCRVIPGDEMMQAFAYTHIAPAQKLFLTRSWLGLPLSRINWAKYPGKVKLDAPAVVTAKVSSRYFPKNGEAELIAVDPPSWLKILPGRTHIAAPGTIKTTRWREVTKWHELKLTLAADASGKNKAVNQIFKVVVRFDRTGKDGKAKRVSQTTVLPAIRIEGGSL